MRAASGCGILASRALSVMEPGLIELEPPPPPPPPPLPIVGSGGGGGS